MFETTVEIGALQNRAMAVRLTKGECCDLSGCETNPDGDYILPDFIDGKDYCNAKTEQWIWSIGRHLRTGEILASHTGKFYRNSEYECLWLR